MKIDPMPKVLVWIAVLSTIIMGIFEPVVAFTEDLNSESIRADLCMVVDVNRETHIVAVFYERPDLVVKQGFGFCFDSDAQISPAHGD